MDDLPEYVKSVLTTMRRGESAHDVEKVKTMLEAMMVSRSQRRRRWALALLTVIVYGMPGAGVTTAAAMAGSLPTIDDKHIDIAVSFGERARRHHGAAWAVLKKIAAGAHPALESGFDAIVGMGTDKM